MRSLGIRVYGKGRPNSIFFFAGAYFYIIIICLFIWYFFFILSCFKIWSYPNMTFVWSMFFFSLSLSLFFHFPDVPLQSVCQNRTILSVVVSVSRVHHALTTTPSYNSLSSFFSSRTTMFSFIRLTRLFTKLINYFDYDFIEGTNKYLLCNCEMNINVYYKRVWMDVENNGNGNWPVNSEWIHS